MRPAPSELETLCRPAAPLLALLLAVPAAAQPEIELRARARAFAAAGSGVNAIKRDPAGRYYLLAARGNVVHVFDAAGQRLGQIPAAAPTGAATSAAATLHYGEDLDVACPEPGAAAGCRVYVADRGANAVRLFRGDGTHLANVAAPAPTSVVVLPDGEWAVATARGPRLVQVFDAQGRPVREFGVPAEIAATPEMNRFVNIGRLATDAAGHVYYAFSYRPEPSVRKYDRFGYAALEIELATLDFLPAAQAIRREIARQDTRAGARAPVLEAVLRAVCVEGESEEVWMAVGGRVVHLDREGARLGTYRLFTAEGVRVEASTLLVEPGRLLVGTETLGVFEFPRPAERRR